MKTHIVVRICCTIIVTSCFYARLSSATDQIVEAFVSPFVNEDSDIPPYMLEVYKEVSNPKGKICQDRTFVSLPNLDESSSSICSSGKLTFSLRRDEENGRFLSSARVFVELGSAKKSEQKISRKVVVALSLKSNDDLLGYTEIETDKYGSIDITADARRWWARREYEVPEMNINFYVVHPKTLQKSCDDIFWRVSTLVIWQNKSRCRRRIRRPRHRIVSNVPVVKPLMEVAKEQIEDEGGEEEEMEYGEERAYLTLGELTEALEESEGLKLLSTRRKRATFSPQNTSHWEALMDNQKELFLSSLNKKKQKNEEKEQIHSFSKIFLRNLLNSRKSKELLVEAKEFTEIEGKRKEKKLQELSQSLRRSIENRNPRKLKKKRQKCSLKKQTVNFEKIYWDFVLAPKEYSSGRCRGRCEFPLDASVTPTNYAILSAIQRHVTGRGRYPHCVPTKTQSLTLLFKDTNNQLVVKNFDDMVVKACGCR